MVIETCTLETRFLNNAERMIRAKNYRKAKWEEGAAPGDKSSKDTARQG